MTTTPGPQIFHSLTYADAEGARTFLTALGLTEVLTVRNDSDPTIVEHAQYSWRDNGGVMFGSVREGNPHASSESVGRAKCYLVLESDDEVDATYRRVLKANGTSVAEPESPDYGGRGATVADHEGNLWSFGSYAGE